MEPIDIGGGFTAISKGDGTFEYKHQPTPTVLKKPSTYVDLPETETIIEIEKQSSRLFRKMLSKSVKEITNFLNH